MRRVRRRRNRNCGSPAVPAAEQPRVNPKIAQQAAQFLVDVSLTNPDAKEYAFKPLPRPKGRATSVMITEYDLPRKSACPHDVVVTADGKAWYSDFGSQFVGELNPQTGQVTEYEVPVIRQGPAERCARYRARP